MFNLEREEESVLKRNNVVYFIFINVPRIKKVMLTGLFTPRIYS